MTFPQSSPVFRKIWGRRQARPLKNYHKDLMEALLPTVYRQINPDHPFETQGKTWLEIGFGGGEHLAWQAKTNPDITILGCEPFVNGVASLLTHIDKEKLTNVQVVMDDARLLLNALPSQSIDRIFILFPDPWPKKRHQKRRIVSAETLPHISRVLCLGGHLYLATDCADYAKAMTETMEQFSKYFTPNLEGRSSFQERPINWPKTRYEEKGLLAGRKSTYMVYTYNKLGV